MIKSEENKLESSFARDYIEKYLVKVDRKFWTRKVRDFLNNLSVSFSLLEQLYATPKNEEAIKNLTASEILEIVIYLRYRIEEIEAKIKQYKVLSKLIGFSYLIYVIACFLTTDFRLTSIDYTLVIGSTILFSYSLIRTFTFRYYELQYRLIQSYFDNVEEVNKFWSKFMN